MQKPSNFLSRWKYYLLLILITLIAFVPLTFQLYSLKNDALVYFLPYRYQVSESIQHGSFPWWNPFLYTGLPLHSDIQSGVWNPVVMVVSLFTTYNMSVLELELLFYLIVASFGMFKLCRHLGISPVASLVAATAYICSGYITDSGSLIPWITSAAYIPFVFLFFSKLLLEPSLRHSFLFSLSFFLLLAAGYPSFFIFTCYVLLAGGITWLVTRRNKGFSKKLFWYGLASLVVFFMISSPIIFSWLDYLPYYERGGGTSATQSGSNSFPLFSSLSYLLPSAVSRPHPWLATDISVRNASVGIFIFLLFVMSLLRKQTLLHRFILVVIIFSFLFSLGEATPVQQWCYRLLPFMNSFRHPGSMRLFTSIGLILLATPMLDEVLKRTGRKLVILTSIFLVIILGLVLYSYPESNILLKARQVGLSSLPERLGFDDMVVITGIIQLFFLLTAGIMFWQRKTRFIPLLLILNSIIFCWIALPFTFLSKTSPKVINNYIRSFPGGFPIPDLGKSIEANIYSDSTKQSAYGYEKFYEQRITIQDHVITPTLGKDYSQFLKNRGLREELANYSPVYFSAPIFDSAKLQTAPITENIRIEYFSANKMKIRTTFLGDGRLHVFQTYHHNWKASIDNTIVPIKKSNIAFMQVQVPKGDHIVSLHYVPGLLIRLSLGISILTLVSMLVYLSYYAIKRYRPA